MHDLVTFWQRKVLPRPERGLISIPLMTTYHIFYVSALFCDASPTAIVYLRRNCFTKAEELRQKHEVLLSSRAQQENSGSGNLVTMDSASSDEEVDFDEFLSWRAKIS